MILYYLLVLCSLVIFPQEPSTLWMGYYQEDPTNNPEDPTAGILYLDVPLDGTFQGELFFSYAGCDQTFDVGKVSGTAVGKRLNGAWEGVVDGEKIGGNYRGDLNQQGNIYSGTFSNRAGKQKIECDPDGYHVAAKGTWFIRRSNDDSQMNISILDDTDPLEIAWTEIPNYDIYRFVIVDKECLLTYWDLERCMLWAGESDWPDLIYGDGDLPAKPLVPNRTYVITVLAIGDRGVMASSSKEFKL